MWYNMVYGKFYKKQKIPYNSIIVYLFKHDLSLILKALYSILVYNFGQFGEFFSFSMSPSYNFV